MTCKVDACQNPIYVASSGMCNKHYRRWRKHGTVAATWLRGLPLAERFMAHVLVAPSGCWIWVGYRASNGYGHFGVPVNGRLRPTGAHRAAYELFVGPIPAGFHVDHLCRVRRCCNPMHLDAVTPEVNNLRSQSLSSRNLRRTKCLRGHPLEGENLQIIHSRGRVKRRCKACARERRKASMSVGGAQ